MLRLDGPLTLNTTTTTTVSTSLSVEPSPTSSQALDVREWTVRPGDHLWSIAESVTSQGAIQPSDGDIARYWKQLIAANIDRLADPTNPDLVFSGQVLSVPLP